MKRNSDEEFFSSPENVISVLDGDQYGDEARLQYCQNNEMIFFIPFQSVEKQLKEHYDKEGQDGLPLVIYNSEGKDKKVRKRLYSSLVNEMSKAKVFSFINDKKPEEVEIFRTKLIDFLKL